MNPLPRLLIVLALLPAAQAVGQDHTLVPAILAELKAAKDDTARARGLASLCFNLIRHDPDSARRVGERALWLAKRIGDQRALGDAHGNLGWLAAEQGQLERADSLTRIALSIFRRSRVPEHASVALSNLGWIAEKRGDSVAALKRFHEALALSEAANDSASASILLYSIGISYRKANDHAKALDFLERSWRMERALGRRGKEANCLVSLANTHREQGDTARARSAYLGAIAIYKDLNDQQGWGVAEENLGDMAQPVSPKQALTHYLAALGHYEQLGSRTDRAYVLRRMGDAYIALNRTAEAEAALIEGFPLSAEAGEPQLRLEYELAFAHLAAKRGEAQDAMRHFERYDALKDSLQGAGTQRELARLRTEFDTERKEKDNALLRAQNSEQAERIHRTQQRLVGIALIAVLALTAALLFFRNYRQKRRHAALLEELNSKLTASNQEIGEINGLLEMRLLRSQMNPHFIYNSLSSAARLTQAGLQAEALAYLQGFARLLRQVLDHSVDDRVTVEAEAEFLRQYLQLEAVRLDGLTSSVAVAPDLLEEESEVPALIVQPFVENAVLHGLSGKHGDRRLEVRFDRAGDKVRCTITDNGVGRNATSAEDHRGRDHRSLGMQLTRERLLLLTRRLGGERSVQVEDLLGADGTPTGTRVTLLL